VPLKFFAKYINEVKTLLEKFYQIFFVYIVFLIVTPFLCTYLTI